MDPEIQKYTQFLMGGGTKNKLPELTPAEKQKMSDAYNDLFFGLAGQNWGRENRTLGAAWYAALEQIGAMMGTKDKSNPATMYLNQVFAAHRAKWSQTTMTHHAKDKQMEMLPQIKQKWMTDRAKQIGAAMGAINAIITKYQMHNATEAQQTSTVSAAPAAPADINKILRFLAAKQKAKEM